MLGRERVQQPDHAQRGLLVARLAGEPGQPQEPERGGRGAGRDRGILELLAARDQRLVVGGGGEEPAALGVGEAVEDLVRDPFRLGEPARLERCFVQRQQRLEQERVVLEVGAQVRGAAVVRAQQAAVGPAQLASHELGGVARGVEIARLSEDSAGVRQRRDHERVPGRQPLVVEPGAHALLARRQQGGLDVDQPDRVRRGADGDVRALEVARVGHAEMLDRRVGELGLERGPYLVEPPHVEAPLDALGVGVERAREAALCLQQLAQRPVERLARHALEERLTGDLEAVQVRACEQRVVVEHLLEVRDDPAVVDRVTGEAAADLVVHAAGGHPAQRVQRHLALAAPQEELDHGCRGELRRAAPAAPVGVVRAAQHGLGGVERRRVELGVGRLDGRRGAQALDDPAGRAGDLVPLLAPRAGDALQHHRPARHVLPRLRRVVGAGVERHAVRREERVQRPAAVAGHRLYGVHVDGVDVRALLAVDLDAHEVLVHERCHRRVLERLALHHVAPVAGGVADRDEQRAILVAGARERLLTPRVPVHGVVLVLEQIRRGLVGQPVHTDRFLPCPIIAKP